MSSDPARTHPEGLSSAGSFSPRSCSLTTSLQAVRTLSVGPAASNPVWVQMLTIFVPALVALLVVVIGQAWTAAAGRRAEERTAWRALQQSALLETQDQLMGFWLATAKVLRGVPAAELKFTLQDANARLTVLGTRIADRQLATDLATWQYEMNLETQRVVRDAVPLTPEQVNQLNPRFIALSDRLGATALALRPGFVR